MDKSEIEIRAARFRENLEAVVDQYLQAQLKNQREYLEAVAKIDRWIFWSNGVVIGALLVEVLYTIKGL